MTTLRRMFGFERFSLVLAVGSIAAFSWLVFTNPVSHGIAAPRVSMPLPEPIEIVDIALPTSQPEKPKFVKLPLTVENLSKAFDKMDYRLNPETTKSIKVPRLYLASLPRDLSDIREVKKRKALFFKTVLPLILKTNEEIRSDRQRLWRLHYQTSLRMPMSAMDSLWLNGISQRYGVRKSSDNVEKTLALLLARVDTVPVSLALAQAAEESGWGTSRFAKEGNALFGQWTYKAKGGIKPKDRDEGATHSIKAFPKLGDAVRAYMHNLNTHRAYHTLRKLRQDARRQGNPISGHALAAGLNKYSARGADYVASLRAIIVSNELSKLDGAAFSGFGPTI